MATIFSNKRIERNEITGSRMKFPDANLTNLPFSCDRSGQSGILIVTDEKGTQWELTIKNVNGKVFFTDGWNAFRDRRGITIDHEISLSKDDEADQYRIIVRRK